MSASISKHLTIAISALFATALIATTAPTAHAGKLPFGFQGLRPKQGATQNEAQASQALQQTVRVQYGQVKSAYMSNLAQPHSGAQAAMRDHLNSAAQALTQGRYAAQANPQGLVQYLAQNRDRVQG